MSQKPFRLRFNFWLDLNKPEEEAIADQIEVLKNERSFSKVIRDGIRLVSDLRNGKLDVLFELFPWVRAEFLAYLQEVQQEPVLQDENQSIEAARRALQSERQALQAERQQQQAMLQQQLERVEQLLLQQGNQPLETLTQQTITMQPISGGPTQMHVPQFSAPTFDDEDDDDLIEVKQDTEAGCRASQNFINSLMALQQ